MNPFSYQPTYVPNCTQGQNCGEAKKDEGKKKKNTVSGCFVIKDANGSVEELKQLRISDEQGG